jgi:hypothetical protein
MVGFIAPENSLTAGRESMQYGWVVEDDVSPELHLMPTFAHEAVDAQEEVHIDLGDSSCFYLSL